MQRPRLIYGQATGHSTTRAPRRCGSNGPCGHWGWNWSTCGFRDHISGPGRCDPSSKSWIGVPIPDDGHNLKRLVVTHADIGFTLPERILTEDGRPSYASATVCGNVLLLCGISLSSKILIIVPRFRIPQVPCADEGLILKPRLPLHNSGQKQECSTDLNYIFSSTLLIRACTEVTHSIYQKKSRNTFIDGIHANLWASKLKFSISFLSRFLSVKPRKPCKVRMVDLVLHYRENVKNFTPSIGHVLAVMRQLHSEAQLFSVSPGICLLQEK